MTSLWFKGLAALENMLTLLLIYICFLLSAMAAPSRWSMRANIILKSKLLTKDVSVAAYN